MEWHEIYLCYNLIMETAELDQLIHRRQLTKLCRQYHIKRLSIFGSALRTDFTPDSDIDILVEFEAGHVPGLDFFLLEAELSKLVGRKVDLQTPQFLSQQIRGRVLSEAKVAYEQA